MSRLLPQSTLHSGKAVEKQKRAYLGSGPIHLAPLVWQILFVTRHICAGTLIEFQADVTTLSGHRFAIPCRAAGHGENPPNPKDDKTASFQRHEPFAINPLVAACLKPLNFRGFDASGARLIGPDPRLFAGAADAHLPLGCG